MTIDLSEESIVEELSIHAPAERVFEALTNPEQIVRWWGIEGRFQATHVESDLRPSGRWRMCGTRMNGRRFVVQGTYREVVRPHVLVFTWLPDWQEDRRETLVRFELAEHDGITTVRLTHSGFSTDTSRQAHQGWPQLLDRLRAYAEREGRT